MGWSGINYKDALAASGKGKILRRYPLNGGIDVAGTVVESGSEHFQPGDRVLANGSGLSETRDGGYSEYLRLPAEIVVALPDGLDMREAMGIGTAGFSAAMSLYRMEENGQRPGHGTDRGHRRQWWTRYGCRRPADRGRLRGPRDHRKGR